MAGPSGSGTPFSNESTVWSSRVLYYLDKSYVYVNALTNRDYEGEVRKGGTVKIFRVNSVAVDDFTGGWTDADWDDLGDTEVEFTITKEKVFRFKLPKVREQFSTIQMIDQGAMRAAQQIGDVIDQYVASKYTQVDAGNLYGTTGTPITVGLGSGEIKPTLALARLRELLVTAKAPTSSPRVVIPEWMGTMLEIELGGRLTNLGDAVIGGAVVNKPGYMGNVSGFQVFVSPNVPNTTATKYRVFAGDPMITYASCIDTVETLSLQNDFSKAVKGLYVFDAKLLDGKAMAMGCFNKGAYA